MKKWWAESMECYCYLRNMLDLVSDGKTSSERRFGEPFKEPIVLFGAVECYPISTRDQSRLHQFGKKVSPGTSLGYVLIAGIIWKGDILISDIEELEEMDESDICSQRINAKEVLIPQKGEGFIFPIADGTAKLLGRDYEFREPTQRRLQTVRSEDLSGELQGELGVRQTTESRDDA